MRIFNAAHSIVIPSDGDNIQVKVIFDCVNDEIYINHIMYNDRDIKSLIDSGMEDQIEFTLLNFIKKI